MKLNINNIRGRLNIEKHSNSRVIRYIHHLNWMGYCLIRIYEFQAKTVVIASQLSKPILWNSYLISSIVKKFNLNYQYLVWINHIGLFSDFRPAEEEFIHTIVSEQKSRFSLTSKDCKLCSTNRLTLQQVEELIECNLEPVESWFGLSSITSQKREEEYQERIQKLLHLYLQKNFNFFAKQLWLMEIISQAQLGAIFFYPERQDIQFLKYVDLEGSNNEYERQAFLFMEKYDPVIEMVFCVCTNSGYVHCGVFSNSCLEKNLIS